MDITNADLARIRELYTQGRYRQALAASEPFGALATWTSTPGRLLAGRLAMQLGAPRLGRKLHAAAFRNSPSNLEAVYYHARYRFEKFGPLASWQFIRQQTDWADASPELRADWLALNGFVLSRLHDFDRAERFIQQAEALAPNRAWIHVERAAIFEASDRHDDSLAAARKALELYPWFRPAVQAVAHLLHKQRKDDEAVAFLLEATKNLESGIVAAQLSALQIELHRPQQAEESLNRYEEFSPLLEKEGKTWLAARRADVAYALGRFADAEKHARAVGEEFYTDFADRLKPRIAREDTKPQKKLIAVECTSSVSSVYDLLGHFWKHPLPNPQGDELPALDGLPDAGERQRAEKAGWVCREFTLTDDAAAELIAAQLPFLVTLVEVGVSQPRLVIGHDPIRGSVFLLDGHENRPAEAPLAVLLKRYRTSGPRCLVLVPKAEESRLKPFADLLDADAYNRLYAIHQQYTAGRGTDAKATLAAFQVEYAGHRLLKIAAILWARLTAHPVLLLDAMDEMLAEHPDEPTFILTKAAALRELGRTPERRAILRESIEKPDADPLLVQSYAQMLLADHRHHADACQLLRRSVRVRPHAAAGYFLLGSRYWDDQRFAEAVELYRFACCLDDREEQFSDAYFRVAKVTEQVPEALRLFQRRATKPDNPHPSAVRALFNSLVERDESKQAFAALDKAIGKQEASESQVELHLRKQPEDTLSGPDTSGGSATQAPTQSLTPQANRTLGELLLFRAEAYAQHGRHAEAKADLERAKSLVPIGVWSKAAARVARITPDPAAVHDHLKVALENDPTWTDGHRLIVGVLVDSHGMTAARAYVSTLAKRYPFSYPVQRLRAELLSPMQDDAAVLSVKNVLDLCPHDAWAHRQLALVLADQKQDTAALEETRLAGNSEPDHPSHYAVLAHVHRRADRLDDTLETYRKAIRNNVDHDLAISELIRLSRGNQEKHDNLLFIAEQLRTQPHNGDGLVAYRDQILTLASDEEEHDDLLESLHQELEQNLEERPDLWQSWSLMIQQLGLMQRLEEALSLAEEGTERFPLISQLWSDLARVHGALEQSEDRVEALRKAVAATPEWAPASLELSESLAEIEEHDEALAVLERNVARNPTDPTSRAAFAERLWNGGHTDEALGQLKVAIRLDPGFDTAWRMLLHWSDRAEQSGDVVELARELTVSRPGDARGWLKLARLLHEPDQTTEALHALETVLQLDPRNVEAYDQKAELLTDLGRYDEAIEAATPVLLADEMPFVLRGRAAWVEAKRGNYAKAIPPMQKLVSVEPEYFWGWQQLAEWYNETDRNENYLEAASELVRLKPDHPLPLTMRGEAKLKNGDRSGGKNDLREALKLAPQYAPAAAILFDSCLHDGEIRESRSALAILQEHAAGPEVLVKQIQLACRTDDSDAALRTLGTLAAHPNEGAPVSMQMALTEIEEAGWGDDTAAVLRDSFSRGEPFNPWAAIYWLDTDDGENSGFADRLAAIDTVIAAYPTFAAGYDRKTELLASVGRFDEAAATCRAPALGDPAPLTLRGRAAWVEAKRGNRAKAISIMKQVVHDDPQYLWGWRNLAQWYDAEGRYRDCLEAADEMVKLAPDDPIAYGYRGEARRTLGDTPGAKTDFAKAFELDPSFDVAGLHLIAIQLEQNDVEGANRTLARVQEHSEGPMLLLRGTQVAVKQGNLPLARQRLKALATEEETPVSFLQDAMKLFDSQGWTAEANEELGSIVTSPDAGSSAAAVWAERRIAEMGGSPNFEELPKLFESNPLAGREATIRFANAMAERGQPQKAAEVLQRFDAHLRAEVEAWAKAGAVLSNAKAHAEATTWLHDWKTRDDLEPWMLEPLMDSLRAQDRDAEAREVAEAAIKLDDDPSELAAFRSWLALAAGVEGQTEHARTHLNGIDRIGLSDGLLLVIAMAESLAMVQQATPDQRSIAFSEAKENLKAAAGACDAKDLPPGVGRWYRSTVQRLAADAGGLGAKLWAWWQQTRPWVRA